MQRGYALGLSHKHIPEMQAHAGLAHPPLVRAQRGAFLSRHAGGIAAAVLGAAGQAQSRATFMPRWPMPMPAGRWSRWRGLEEAAELKTLDAEILAGSNRMKLFVFANEAAGQARLVAALDNLGKGAGGAAVQNLNIMLGLPETTGSDLC